MTNLQEVPGLTPGALSATEAPRSRVISWALWDWGTQPFATVITTFVFSVYLTSSAFGPKDEVTMKLAWATGLAGLLIALLAPVLGQGADRTGKRMFHLRWQTWVLAAICAAMYFVAPAPEYFLLGAALLGAGNVISEIANVNYYAAIDQVSTPRNVGRVSGLGWGLGYLGGIAILLLIIAVRGSEFGPDDVRVAMLFCGAWTLVFTVPIFVALKDRRPDHVAPKIGILGSYRELFRSIKWLARTAPNTLFFYIAAALFRDGLAGVFTFGGVLAAGTFGFAFSEVVMFGVAANVIAGVATIGFGLIDDRIGPKTVILTSLVSLIALGTAIFIFHDGGKPVFWALGLAMCIFVGPAQSASRSFLARLIPEGHSGEMFGLYATTGRAVSFLAPTMFGVAIAVGATFTDSAEESAQHWGILGIVLVLAVGFVFALFVKDPSKHPVVAVPPEVRSMDPRRHQ
ncbi:MFS transporter [Tessaracoccus flavus]|uniref:MFS transporter n=1 Tax=Tessaracoccus flavus TaxID=1610493 RepID=UPI0008995D9A|nr:MFS transporter [Tessaracoccus flavus]SDZ14499.1 MFS transporter, UMF1 family [Tessaracoccus flavus]